MARLRVHALSDPTAAARALPAIRRIVLGVLGATDTTSHEVIIGPSSGWLSVRVRGELWDRRTPPVLPDGPEAKRRAEQAIGRLAAACSAANPQWPPQLEKLALLPQRMTPADLSLVPRAAGGADHWLYRAQPVLHVDEARRRAVPVLGTMVSVRVGHLGQIVSVTSQWRSTNGEELLAEAATPVAGHDETDAHSGEHHTASAPPIANTNAADDAPRHVYVLDGAGLPQHYLAPYIQVADHHGAGLASGCAWALTVAFGREQRAQDMVITAQVQGGSGDYRFAWASHRLDAPDAGLALHEGQTRLVDTPAGRQAVGAVTLPNGARVLMVQVQDRATGAFKHFQQQVFSHPLALAGTDEAAAAQVA